MSKFELKKQLFNNHVKKALQLVSLAVVLFILFAHTIAMGSKAMINASPNLENFDFNRFVTNINILQKLIFDVSPLILFLYTIAKVAVLLTLIPLFIHLFFRTTYKVSTKEYSNHRSITITNNIVCDRVYKSQEKFLC